MSRNGDAGAGRIAGDDRVGDVRIFDVVVAGAGPAGAIAARHLALAGRSVLILDRLRPSAPRHGETLPGAARRLLVRAGLGGILADDPHHAPVTGGLVVWGGDLPVATDALRDPYGPGLRLDRARFDAALRAESLAAGSLWSETDVRDLERDGDEWIIHRDDGPPVRSRVIIDATGRSARLLRLLGQSRLRGAPLVALYRIARPETHAEMERTLIEARPDGWIYAGRIGNGSWAIGYHTSRDGAAFVCASEAAHADELATAPHLAGCLGQLAWEGPLITRDARSLAASATSGPGWFAIGDAALAFDPLAGQGLFNALRTGIAAAEAILDGSEAGRAAYTTELARVAAIYRHRRHALYRSEMRWPNRPFWREQADETSHNNALATAE